MFFHFVDNNNFSFAAYTPGKSIPLKGKPSLNGIHGSLDVLGFFIPGADATNAVLYVGEGVFYFISGNNAQALKSFGEAALSGVSELPLGDLIKTHKLSKVVKFVEKDGKILDTIFPKVHDYSKIYEKANPALKIKISEAIGEGGAATWAKSNLKGYKPTPKISSKTQR
ncbi:hypothetical protein IQ270_09885 [Microcoleus sp. LEGE 07076]|uniref:hypothetical protein n=1 Tax=Microcoleus sp. LEGE 07076 TaxID=915322 RepID=UPI0018819D9F|nr:hypothetical protein [Microcoleus sp. LEGE 07076]MBE9185015.1 hypothetical protein [Microcoleus sp. LEGE 07076]